jgi:Prokaryotic Cytochrome C oxidase subunit IV
VTIVVLTRATVVWAVLVAATGTSLFLGTNHGLSSHDAKTIGTSIIFVIAFVKIRFVGMDFMELRDAPRALRLAFHAWIVLVGGGVIVLYLHGQ